MQRIRKEQSNHNTIVYRGSATRTSLVLALRPRPEYPTREFQALSTSSFIRRRKPYTSLTIFTDTKLDVEFFTKGTTTPN